MGFDLYGNNAETEFKVGDRVKRANDGMAGVIVTDSAGFRRAAGEQKFVEVKWDRSGSKSVRPADGLIRE